MGRPRSLSSNEAVTRSRKASSLRAKEHRIERIALGRCVQYGCRRKLFSKTYCKKHLAQINACNEGRRKAKRREGQCRDCRDDAIVGFLFCESCAEKARVRSRHHGLKRYGLSSSDYELMLKKQKNKCCVCKTTFDEKGAKNQGPHVDHCHKTDKVRGILCGSCNTALGLLHDDPSLFRSAIRYLRVRTASSAKPRA